MPGTAHTDRPHTARTNHGFRVAPWILDLIGILLITGAIRAYVISQTPIIAKNGMLYVGIARMINHGLWPRSGRRLVPVQSFLLDCLAAALWDQLRLFRPVDQRHRQLWCHSGICGVAAFDPRVAQLAAYHLRPASCDVAIQRSSSAGRSVLVPDAVGGVCFLAGGSTPPVLALCRGRTAGHSGDSDAHGRHSAVHPGSVVVDLPAVQHFRHDLPDLETPAAGQSMRQSLASRHSVCHVPVDDDRPEPGLHTGRDMAGMAAVAGYTLPHA